MTQAYDQVDGLCKPALSMATNIGHGDIQAGKRRIAELVDSGDEGFRMPFNLLKRCEDDSSRLAYINEITQDISYGIYSLGSYTFQGKSCKGYITKTQATIDGLRTVGHSLIGMGVCNDQVVDKGVFHPVNNPSGVKAGDFYKNTLAYDGEIPINWLFKGKVYPFTTEAPTADPLATTPTHEESTETVAGKFVISSYNDFSNHHKVALNNKVIEKCNGRSCSEEYFSINVEKAFDVNGATVLFMGYGDGGTACNATYGFFTIRKDGTYESSDELGNCTELEFGSIVQSDSKIILSLPSQEENSSKNDVWTYENGKVTGSVQVLKP